MISKIDALFEKQDSKNRSETLKLFPINDKKNGCHRPEIKTLLHSRVNKDKLTKEEQARLDYYMEDVKGIVDNYEEQNKFGRRLKTNKCKGMGTKMIDVPYGIPVIIPRAFVCLMNRMVTPKYAKGVASTASKYIAGAENSIPALKLIGSEPRLVFRPL